MRLGTAEKVRTGWWGVWPEECSSCFTATLEQSGKLRAFSPTPLNNVLVRKEGAEPALRPSQLKHVVVLHRVSVCLKYTQRQSANNTTQPTACQLGESQNLKIIGIMKKELQITQQVTGDQ